MHHSQGSQKKNIRSPGVRLRGELAKRTERAKFNKHAADVKPDAFAAAVVECFGNIGPDFRNVIRVIAEVTTHQSAMDLDLSEKAHKFLIGAHMNRFYGNISCSLQKAVAAQLRAAANIILSRRANSKQHHRADFLQRDQLLLGKRSRPTLDV